MVLLNCFNLDILLRIDLKLIQTVSTYGSSVNIIETKERSISNDGERPEKAIVHIRNGLNYMRMHDLSGSIQLYMDYLQELKRLQMFDCCNIEQALGIFNEGRLCVFMFHDSGICYDILATLKCISDFIINGESHLEEINSFYGKSLGGDRIRILYDRNSNNIDIRNPVNEEFIITETRLRNELANLIQRADVFYGNLNRILKSAGFSDWFGNSIIDNAYPPEIIRAMKKDLSRIIDPPLKQL